MSVSVWIRTHNQRLYLAEELKAMCHRQLGEVAHLLNSGDASVWYTEIFILGLARALQTDGSEYFLLLEDDIEIFESALSAIREGMSRGDSHNWYTVDLSTNVLEAAVLAPGFGYLLQGEHRLTFSGAILIQRDLLREFLEFYLLHYTELEFPNFDIQLSRFISGRLGHLHIRPGHFDGREGICTSIRKGESGRVLTIYSDPNAKLPRYCGVPV